MTVQETLPSLSPTLARLHPPLLHESFDPANEEQFKALFLAIVMSQAEIGHEINALATSTKTLVTEIVAAKDDRDQIAIVALNTLQLCAATGALGQCVITAQLIRAGDWFIASMNDDLCFGESWPEGPFEVGRLADILLSESPFMKLNGAAIICQWAAQAYLYLRRMRTFTEAGKAAIDPCIEAVKRCISANMVEGVDALLRMTEWAASANHDSAESLVELLELLYEVGTEQTALRAAGTLSTNVGRFSKRTPREWAEIIHQKHWAQADPGIKLAALASLYNERDLFIQHQAEILSCVDAFTEPALHTDKFTREQYLESAFQAIYPFVNLLLRSGLTSELLSLIFVFYRIGADALRDAIIVAPSFASFCVWASSAGAQQVDHGIQDAHRHVTIAANRALRIVITLENGETGFERDPFDARLHGVPDEGYADTLESETGSFLALEALKVGMLPKPPTPIVPLISLPTPLQAVMLRTIGAAWPIAVSLQEPLPERKLARVGIWHHPLMHGDLEVDILAAEFARNGIYCTVETSGGADERERFKRLYTNAGMDVIWIIGHGEKPAYEPDNAFLKIFEHSGISTKELCNLPVPETGASRLLVLNVCSAASTVAYGGIPRVSLAALLTDKHQKVVAHLWPAQALAAATFGVLLGHSMSTGMPPFDAYKAVLGAMNREKEAIAANIAQLAGNSAELASRVSRTMFNFRSILNSGSATFLQ